MEKSNKMEWNLTEYLSKSIDSIIKDAVKAALKNPKERAFLLKYSIAAKKAAKKREAADKRGERIPPFLIASITEQCNLNCTGCYAQAGSSCKQPEKEKATDVSCKQPEKEKATDVSCKQPEKEKATDVSCKQPEKEKATNISSKKPEMSKAVWERIFNEAKELGVSAILLAGGEPFMRPDVITAAAAQPSLLFPIFTNGTTLCDKEITMLDKHRNLVPILSMEGDEAITDSRRGSGVYKQIDSVMRKFCNRHILFGASITVTRENVRLVTNKRFINDLYQKGCRIVFFVEYVPVENELSALTDMERKVFEDKFAALRDTEMIFISFPGDEKTTDGCLAAGRGFFHIAANGDAEPCPFSPYSDTNLCDISLREALSSPLFSKLLKSELLTKPHVGGCVLFENKEQVCNLLISSRDT